MESELHTKSSTARTWSSMPRRSNIAGEATIMYLETPPKLIATKVFTSMPDQFRRKGVATEWADANRPDQPTDSFIEVRRSMRKAISTLSTFPSAASSGSRPTGTGHLLRNMRVGRMD
jgi:hypothetical protein